MEPHAAGRTTLVLEAGGDPETLQVKLQRIRAESWPDFGETLLVFPPGKGATGIKSMGLPGSQRFIEIRHFRDLLPRISTPFLACLPDKAPFSFPPLEGLDRWESGRPFLRPWIPPAPQGAGNWARSIHLAFGWVAEVSALKGLEWGGIPALRDLETGAREATVRLPYFSTAAGLERPEAPKTGGPFPWPMEPRILGLIPHFGCEEWLEQCLGSLVHQTRPLDALAVLDDGSPDPPLETVKKYPRVTLLRSPENVGPYRLIQTAMEQTHFDAYLFQDADDWSSLDRLELLLKEAELSGAEWIGTQEIVYFKDALHAVRYPPDAHKDHAAQRYPFSCASSLISRKFWARLGGFASGLRFSGDMEFFNRAVLAGKVAVLDRYGYFRRIRRNSLITSEKTGLGSPARREVDRLIEARKAENLFRVSTGRAPLLEPLWTAPPVRLERLAGPPLEKTGP
jgi:Glycosyl transferase family 2